MPQQVHGSINVFIVNDGKVLLGRRINTGWMDGHLCPPGGHIEPQESPRQAALREIQEELGLELQTADLEFLCVAARNTSPNQYVAYEFIVKRHGLKIINNEPEKCSELVWVATNKLPDDVVPEFRSIIEQCIVGNQNYLELGFS